METEITVVKSKRRTLSMEVKPDGSVLIKAPVFVSDDEIERFVKSRSAWIDKTVRKVLVKNAGLSEVKPMTEAELKALKKKAKTMIMPLVEEYSDMMGVTYGTVSFRTQKTRWGSCSGKGNLNFNCLLALCPEGVMRYVVVHELCHRRHMNHSKAFWNMVEEFMPDYKEQRQYLKRNGDLLMARL